MALGFVTCLLIALALWLGVTYSGAYDVAATDPHADPVRWTLDTAMHRSIRRQARDVEFPESIPPALIEQGARHYAHSCVHCHGAPGEEPAEWSRGMRPEPPQLTEAATEWEPEEIYWIVENGIKMTGMPAFGLDHDDRMITAIAAFVQQLPGLSPEDYAALTEQKSGGESGGHAHGTHSHSARDAH